MRPSFGKWVMATMHERSGQSATKEPDITKVWEPEMTRLEMADALDAHIHTPKCVCRLIAEVLRQDEGEIAALAETLKAVYDELTNIELHLERDDPSYQGWWVKWDDARENVVTILEKAEGTIREARR